MGILQFRFQANNIHPKAMVALMGHVAFGLVMSAIIGKPDGE